MNIVGVFGQNVMFDRLRTTLPISPDFMHTEGETQR